MQISKEMLPCEITSQKHHQAKQGVHGHTTSTRAPGDPASGPGRIGYDRNGKVSLEMGKWVNVVCHGTESAKVTWEEIGEKATPTVAFSIL